MKACTHEKPCRITTKSTGHGHRTRVCLEQRRVQERRRRAELRGDLKDGWEDEFGPMPKPVPDKYWYDEVAVDNAMFGGLNRPLTRREMEEYVRRTRTWSQEEAAQGARVSEIRIRDLRAWYLTDKPARLKKAA